MSPPTAAERAARSPVGLPGSTSRVTSPVRSNKRPVFEPKTPPMDTSQMRQFCHRFIRFTCKSLDSLHRNLAYLCLSHKHKCHQGVQGAAGQKMYPHPKCAFALNEHCNCNYVRVLVMNSTGTTLPKTKSPARETSWPSHSQATAATDMAKRFEDVFEDAIASWQATVPGG